MKSDPLIHVVLDANVLAAALTPKVHRSQRVSDVSRRIVASVVDCAWPLIRLHAPLICLTEAQCVLDKHFYCTWHGPTKDPSRRLTKAEYKHASERLRYISESRRIERLDLTTDHLRLVPLVAAVNFKYQIRRKRKDAAGQVKSHIIPPMGASDCLVAAISIDLASKVGPDSVKLITADRRLADVLSNCRRISSPKARSLALDSQSKAVGLTWTNAIYPECLDLNADDDATLKRVLAGWPLPTKVVTATDIRALSKADERLLFMLGTESKTLYRVGPDSLPYTDQLDEIQLKFSCETGKFITKAEIARKLLQWRKNPRLRPVNPD